jgi:DNA-binding NtrC family response regulator
VSLWFKSVLMKKILVIDDDKASCDLLREIFEEQGWQVEMALSPAAASSLAETQQFDLVVSDINLEADTTGIDLLRSFREKMPVILITAFGSLESSIEARREGAWDLISKPFNFEDVITAAERALRSRSDAQPENSKSVPEVLPGAKIVGRSSVMITLFNEVARVAPTHTTVLIIGESGTGKELIARAIHDNSPRANSPFVPINCGAITETLLEAELFGHVKGSFTGANVDRAGLFELADSGTLFLDEIGETSPAMQVKLLRALQEGEVRRIGSPKPIKVDVRIVAATNRDLEAEVKAGHFREDLFYRISVVTLRVPCLRDRRSDIPLLSARFLAKAGTNLGKRLRWSDDALSVLSAYNWPGNVRELENAVEAAALHARSEVVEVDDLPAKVQTATPLAQVRKKHPEFSTLYSDLPTLDELERRYMLYVLEAVGQNRSRAAEVLGIDRRTLYRMAERFGVNLDEA